MKKLLLTLALGGLIIPLFSQTARLQVIHNSADAAADTVDVYLNGSLLLDNFAFRTASPFIDAPAGTQLQVAIAPKTSTSVNDTIAGLTSYYTLTANEKYVLVADGIVSATGYTPSKAFGIKVYAMGREASSTSGNTDVLVHHGSTDAPTVDVKERTAGLIVDNLSYADFQGYLELATADYTLDIYDQTGTTPVASYSAPLATLSLTNKALVVVASGFLAPSQNSNGKAFGLWVALPAGGNLVELPTTAAPTTTTTPTPSPTARVQVIHNSADAAADTVDVYLNGSLLLDNFAFRTASPFIDAPAGTQLQVAIAPKTSTSVNDTIAGLTSYYTLTANEKYVLVADGIVSATGYTPSKAFGVKVYAMGRETSKTTGNTDVLVHHGSTDAPTVDVKERIAGLIVDDLSYADFQGYLELTTADYTLDIYDQTGTTPVASYSAPLATLSLTNKALVVVASGFLAPSQNSNGKAFGLWVALPTGGNLVELPKALPLSVNELFVQTLSLYPNPTTDFVTVSTIDLAGAIVRLTDISGKQNEVEINTINGNKIDLSNNASGIYLIEVIKDQVVIGRAKFVKI
ncbi:conserved hypothetical protein, secreted [sediment metagenome]|uniref:DUF4397 domain-containing protein n=1 Tax=sediment metagenome TaxID=749907 RepID=D9PEZ0_9ZZZZ